MRYSCVLEYGDRSRHLPSEKLALFEIVKEQGKEVAREQAFFGEPALASEILNLLEDDVAKIDLLAGHGELDPDSFRADGFNAARDAMREERMEVRARFLLETGKVPPDTRVLVVAGAREPLEAAEVAAIRQYLEGGGGLFVAQEPQRHTGLEPLLASFGISLGENLVLDRENKAIRTDASTLYIARKGSHVITNPLGTAAIRLSRCRTVDRLESPTIPKRLDRVDLLLSSDASWAESDLATMPPKLDAGSADRKGPVGLAMAAAVAPDPSDPASLRRGGTRLVVLGSRDSLTNGLLSKFGMTDFFLNSVNWLAKRDRFVTLRPRTPDLRPLRITEKQGRRLALAAYLGPPGLFLVVGLWIAWRRRA
jgi:ABC-type uncharacterized transport system involved in gliding motility auxiliary subunit